MLTLKYTNSTLFTPLQLKVTKIIKAEDHHRQDKHIPKASNKKSTAQNSLPLIKQYNNEWPAKKNIKFLGLSNLGNTCYLNSLLQSVLNVPQLYHGFRSLRGQQFEFESRFGGKGNPALIQRGNKFEKLIHRIEDFS